MTSPTEAATRHGGGSSVPDGTPAISRPFPIWRPIGVGAFDGWQQPATLANSFDSCDLRLPRRQHLVSLSAEDSYRHFKRV
jgi:hypothetical protein